MATVEQIRASLQRRSQADGLAYGLGEPHRDHKDFTIRVVDTKIVKHHRSPSVFYKFLATELEQLSLEDLDDFLDSRLVFVREDLEECIAHGP